MMSEVPKSVRDVRGTEESWRCCRGISDIWTFPHVFIIKKLLGGFFNKIRGLDGFEGSPESGPLLP